MPQALRAGHILQSAKCRYEITKELRRGNWSNCYQGRRSDGSLAFLKQYKNPTPAVSWYRKYVEYEQRKLRRLEDAKARRYCLLPTDIFEAKDSKHAPANTLYQAFDFVEVGGNLKDQLEELKRKPATETWKQRLTFARVFLAALDAVAEVGLVHGDLKPENIHLIHDPAIAAGYRTRLIDMDGSIFVDDPAPWHGSGVGFEGYLGTPGYISPEHSVKPLPASDVFTASLIVHELLCRERPHPDYGTAQEIVELLGRTAAPLPSLLGDLGTPAKDQHLRKVLQACLSLKAAARPSLKELRSAVMGDPAVVPPVAGHDPKPVGGKSTRLLLRHSSGRQRSFGIRTSFGRQLARLFHGSGELLREEHFVLRPGEFGDWQIEVSPSLPSAGVLVNREAVESTRPLRTGDLISVTPSVAGTEAFTVEVEIQ